MSTPERRRRARFSVTGPIVILTQPDEEIQGELVDVSLLGFRFRSTELLQVGDAVAATVRFPSGKTHRAEGVVKHASETPPFDYGVAFTEETMERIIKESFGVSS